MYVDVAVGTPLAEALQKVVQPKLIEVGWTTDGLDGSALSEYIILMLVNGKTQEQIATELSNDFLGLGPDDQGAALDFSSWLFEQVEKLQSKFSDGDTTPLNDSSNNISNSNQAVASPNRSSSQLNTTNDNNESKNAIESSERSFIPNISKPTFNGGNNGFGANIVPSGPKAMRNNSYRSFDKRTFGHTNKLLDRSAEASLHRIRNSGNVGRINSHLRDSNSSFHMSNPGLMRGSLQQQMLNNYHFQQNSGNFPQYPMTMTPQQQMQLFAMFEEQARKMTELMGQGFGLFNSTDNDGNSAASKCGDFRGNFSKNPNLGKSLFERVEKANRRTVLPSTTNTISSSNCTGNTAGSSAIPSQTLPSAQSSSNISTSEDHEMTDASTISSRKSASNSDNSQPSTLKNVSDLVCRYNLSCTRADCQFAHQSPAAPRGITIDVSDVCSFGPACKNFKCVGRHPSPAKKILHQAEKDCAYWPNCTKPSCPFRHPEYPPCRNGGDCNVVNCKFTHSKIMCKFDPCLNPTCFYKHAPDQKRGSFADKVWKANEVRNGGKKDHVSQRKFVNEDMEEEVIIPGRAVEEDLEPRLVEQN